MSEHRTIDSVSNFFFGTLDKVTTGISSYFDGAIAFDNAKAKLRQSKIDKQNLRTVNQLDVGSPASNWGNPAINNGFLNASNPSTLLIAGGVALVLFAIVKAK